MCFYNSKYQCFRESAWFQRIHLVALVLSKIFIGRMVPKTCRASVELVTLVESSFSVCNLGLELSHRHLSVAAPLLDKIDQTLGFHKDIPPWLPGRQHISLSRPSKTALQRIGHNPDSWKQATCDRQWRYSGERIFVENFIWNVIIEISFQRILTGCFQNFFKIHNSSTSSKLQLLNCSFSVLQKFEKFLKRFWKVENLF